MPSHSDSEIYIKRLSTLVWILIVMTISPLSLCQLSTKTDIHKRLNVPHDKDSLDFVAVFLLTTLGEKWFQNRVKVSRDTWAYPVKHYYAVVGGVGDVPNTHHKFIKEAEENIQILHNTSRCQNLTSGYRVVTQHITPATREEIYLCDDIHVLYLPYCDSSSWGPMVGNRIDCTAYFF